MSKPRIRSSDHRQQANAILASWSATEDKLRGTGRTSVMLSRVEDGDFVIMSSRGGAELAERELRRRGVKARIHVGQTIGDIMHVLMNWKPHAGTDLLPDPPALHVDHEATRVVMLAAIEYAMGGFDHFEAMLADMNRDARARRGERVEPGPIRRAAWEEVR